MSEKMQISEKDQKLLRRFYGEQWESHTDELLTVFNYSDAFCQKRRERLAVFPSEQRMLKAIFDDSDKWRPNIARAEEIIEPPLALAANGKEIDMDAMKDAPALFLESCKKINDFADVLRWIVANDDRNPTDWHLEPVEAEGVQEPFWTIKDREGKMVLDMYYPTAARALAFLLLEWPRDIDAWLDYAATYMYDGVNGTDLRKDG